MAESEGVGGGDPEDRVAALVAAAGRFADPQLRLDDAPKQGRRRTAIIGGAALAVAAAAGVFAVTRNNDDSPSSALPSVTAPSALTVNSSPNSVPTKPSVTQPTPPATATFEEPVSAPTLPPPRVTLAPSTTPDTPTSDTPTSDTPTSDTPTSEPGTTDGSVPLLTPTVSLVAPQPLTAEQKGELLVISGSVADKAAHDKFFDQLYSFTDRRNVRDQTYLSPDSTPPGETFNILFRDGLQFASGQAKLDNATAQLALDGLAQLLLARPQAQVTIEGHTDNVGTPGYNLKLSAQRIQATLDYLKTKGVDIARLTVIARGESIPIADNATALGRLANRRIEVTITGLLNG